MKIHHQVVVFDAVDLHAESMFWAGVLQGTVEVEEDWHMVCVDAEPRIGVQLAPEHQRPQWPDGQPQQVHVDLWVEDIETAHRQVLDLGAELLRAVDDLPAEGFRVYADPAGHPFCLCWVK